MLSHQLKQFKIDGEKTIIQNPNEAQRKEHEKCEFELHEVYAIDVLISSGEGIVSVTEIGCGSRDWFFFVVQGREKDTKVSIYKKTEENYQLKLKASRALLTEVIRKIFLFVFVVHFCISTAAMNVAVQSSITYVRVHQCNLSPLEVNCYGDCIQRWTFFVVVEN